MRHQFPDWIWLFDESGELEPWFGLHQSKLGRFVLRILPSHEYLSDRSEWYRALFTDDLPVRADG